MATFEDYYEILGVKPSAAIEDIEAAYKKLVYEYAPYRNNNPAAAETMNKIDAAYYELREQSRRKLYHDRWLENKFGLNDDISKKEAKDIPNHQVEYVPKYKDDTGWNGEVNGRRIAIIILLITNVTLVSIFILTPLISLFIKQNIWVLYISFALLGALVACIIFSARFRYGLIDTLKFVFRSVRKWITSEYVKNNFTDRFVVIVLIIIFIALLVYIYVMPWIYQIWVKGSVIEIFLLCVSLLFIGILLTSRRFWRYCFNNNQSIRSKSASYIPKKASAEYDRCPTSATYIPRQSSQDSANLNISEWTWAPGQMNDSLSTSVWNAILNFRPSRQYGKEQGYHDELFNYLKIKFHTAESNKRKGASQPDIHIDHIAIEVKGPTLKRDLVTLMDKSGRYLAMGHHTILFIVLFQPSSKITLKYFDELKRNWLNRYPDVGVITKRG